MPKPTTWDASSAVQESGLLGEEIFVEDGEIRSVILLGVEVGGGLVVGALAARGEGVLGTFKIVGGSDASEIDGEATVTAGVVPGHEMLAKGGQTSSVGAHRQGLDPQGRGIARVVGLGGGHHHGFHTDVILGEAHIALLHGGGKVHGVSKAGTEHGVHLGGDVVHAHEGLQLTGKRTEVAKGGVGKAGRGQDVREGNIQLVGDVLVIGEDPTSQIADLTGGAFVHGGECVDRQHRVSFSFGLRQTAGSGDRQELARGAITVRVRHCGEACGNDKFHHLGTGLFASNWEPGYKVVVIELLLFVCFFHLEKEVEKSCFAVDVITQNEMSCSRVRWK